MYTFNEYQSDAMETAVYDDPFYPIASLMVEAAELADLYVKPLLRGDPPLPDLEKKLLSEAGDVLWNLTAVLEDNGLFLEDVAHYNISKLRDREERGVLKGNGGNR
jgi:hypothetical protein